MNPSDLKRYGPQRRESVLADLGLEATLAGFGRCRGGARCPPWAVAFALGGLIGYVARMSSADGGCAAKVKYRLMPER